jgi:hypothetical protein
LCWIQSEKQRAGGAADDVRHFVGAARSVSMEIGRLPVGGEGTLQALGLCWPEFKA